MPSHPLLGTIKDSLMKKKTFYQDFTDIYNHPSVKDEPFFGIFLLHKASIVIKDPELMKKILIKDFSSFSNRYSSNSEKDPLGNNIFFAKNPKWRLLRRKMAAFFTSGRFKKAYYLVEEKGKKLIDYLNKSLGDKDRGAIELKKATGLYTIDVIGSIIFGIDAQSLDGVDGVSA